MASTRAAQIHPSTGKIIRQVTVVDDKRADGLVLVRALNGPLAGEEYTVAPEQLRPH
jgi:hypothetical protein